MAWDIFRRLAWAAALAATLALLALAALALLLTWVQPFAGSTWGDDVDAVAVVSSALPGSLVREETRDASGRHVRLHYLTRDAPREIEMRSRAACSAADMRSGMSRDGVVSCSRMGSDIRLSFEPAEDGKTRVSASGSADP